jgi:hypothetical protein
MNPTKISSFNRDMIAISANLKALTKGMCIRRGSNRLFYIEGGIVNAT